ncbi:MAG TPA: hypothetical protein VNZ64_24835 [Candidatus Acidoferrum sp.]|nr:hypothetical protein [Candidatus Acidoferrum sp.]
MSLNPSIGRAAAEVAPVAGQPGSIGQAGTDFVIGISPYLDKSVKDEVYRSLVRLLVEDLPLNSSLAVYDAFDLKSITHVTVPNARAFNSSKTRANQFAPAIRELKQFLAQEHPKPAVSHLDFQSALRLPQFCDFLTENLPHPGSALTVLLIGSPLYQDAKEPAFSMVDGYFPSDGHLQATREQSVFGVAGETKAMTPLRVHWVYFGDPWVNDLHKERVTRFWTLYFDRRAGRLLTLTGDLPSALERFRHGSGDDSVSTRRWAVDSNQTKVEMLRINRDVELTDWLTSDARAETAQSPPATMVGPLKIGIRWKRNIDLDLYATPRRGAETLFFQHPRSPDGYYYKDHRSSPGREYEFIEFEAPVDIRELEAFVNFYKGSCPGGPRGEVRIEFDGRIYGGAFAIPASDGNLGRTGTAQQDCWVRIPVRKILKIEPTTTAGR